MMIEEEKPSKTLFILFLAVILHPVIIHDLRLHLPGDTWLDQGKKETDNDS